MTTNAPLSRNPANNDSIDGLLTMFKTKLLQNLNGRMPAQVISHDRKANRVTVRPLIQLVDTNGQLIQRAKIASVPVLNLGGGGFFLNFNLPEGALGWIAANDRDISLFLQSYKEEKPNTRRMHSFEDSVFIPDVMTGYTISDDDSEAMVIQNLDGSVRIALDENGIRMYSDGDASMAVTNALTIEADTVTVTAPGGITMTADSGINLNGVTIDSSGNVNSPATITASTDVVGGGISLIGHTHPYTWTDPGGSGNTGAPN